MERIRILYIKKKADETDLVKRALETAIDMDIAGIAEGGKAGMEMAKALTPDIILAPDAPDIVEIVSRLQRRLPDTGIIVLAYGTDPFSAQRIVESLTVGAFDFMPLSVTSGKLGAGAFAPNLLLSKIRCCSIKRFSRMARAGNPEVLARSSVFKAQRAQAPEISRQFLKAKYDAALIGVSTGGPEALMRLVPALPKGLRAPIFIALHMPKDFTGPMAALLAKNARMSVEEFGDNKTAIAGNIYLARGGLHGIIACKTDDSVDMRIDDGPPENGCKPSVDALFRSGAARFKDRVAAVVLTGMGNDGVRGAEAIKKQGGLVIVQDEATSVVWGMPGSVARAGFADEILPLDSIAPRLGELLGAGI